MFIPSAVFRLIVRLLMHENAYIKNQPAAANVFFPPPKNFANVYMKTDGKNENAYRIPRSSSESAYKITHKQQ